MQVVYRYKQNHHNFNFDLDDYLSWVVAHSHHPHITDWKTLEYLKIGDTLVKSPAHLKALLMLLGE